MLTSLLTQVALGATLNVGGAAYPTIQSAVDAAEPYDVVRIAPGTYVESVVSPIPLQLIAESGVAGAVIWQAGAAGENLRFSGGFLSTVRVEGITFEGGGDRCVYAGEGAYLEVVDSTFDSCGATSRDGGSIWVGDDGALSLRKVTFTNGLGARGGHVFLDYGSIADFVETNFVGGTSSLSGGALFARGKVRMVATSFITNQSMGDGGAIFADEGEMVCLDCAIEQNNAAGDGGAIYAASEWVDLYGGYACENTAVGEGGAYYRDNGGDETWIYNVIFQDNQATVGGAIQWGDLARGTRFRNNVFARNTASSRGGAVASSGEVKGNHNVFLANGPDAWNLTGGGVHVYNVYWPESAGLVGDPMTSSEQIIDPKFTSVSPGSHCASQDWHPALGSPLVDAGSANHDNDFDATRRDLGIYGGPESPEADGDADGTPIEFDCDDGDAARHWGAPDTCNGIDDNCDENEEGFGGEDGPLIDLSTGTLLTVDEDEDGHGSGDPNAFVIWYCPVGEGFVESTDDCDDFDSNNFPDNPEVCDGEDNDCDPATADPGDPQLYWPDVDNDGQGDANASATLLCAATPGFVTNNSDCADDDPDRFMGNPEICDGVDNNCNSLADEGLQTTSYFEDSDGDTFGAGGGVSACAPPEGWVTQEGDCDDNDAERYPNNPEICDGIDNDCVSGVDNGLPFNDYWPDQDDDGFGDAVTTTIATCDGAPDGYADNDADCDDTNSQVLDSITFYADTDADTFGDPQSTAAACEAPVGFVANANDCDDTDTAIHPDLVWYEDADEDNAGNQASSLTQCTQPDGYVLNNVDCDDTDATVQGNTLFWPDTDGDSFGAGTPESACANSVGFVSNNDDCDDDDANAYPGAVWYQDLDQDTFGGATSSIACLQPAGFVANSDDCNDADAFFNPNTVWNADVDQDGWGGPATTTQCTPPIDHVLNSEDCNDTTTSVGAASEHWPDTDFDGYGDELASATIRCPASGWVRNDDDCDDTTETLSPETPWYPDTDADGHGDQVPSTDQCLAPTGHVRSSTDCDDTDATVFEGADELCDGLDNDCDGQFDDNPVNPPVWFLDNDNDGFGTADNSTGACNRPAGYAALDTDCDDGSELTFPGAAELCDGIDNDCDDTTPDDATVYTWLEDLDGDGYGSATVLATQCMPFPGGAIASGDCADDDATRFPGQVEICDGLDNDCDNDTDSTAVDRLAFWPDDDQDGWGDANGSVVFACVATPGNVSNDEDCDDADVTIHPGAQEQCDGIDEDCDQLIDDNPIDPIDTYADADGDGHGDLFGGSMPECVAGPGRSASLTDCNDANDTVFVGAVEICDGIDNDCNGLVDEGVVPPVVYLDEDGDGFGSTTIVNLVSCVIPDYAVLNSSDCDDGDPLVNPDAVEVLDNGIDDDCDGESAVSPTPPAITPPPPETLVVSPDDDNTVLTFCSTSTPAAAGWMLFLMGMVSTRRRSHHQGRPS